MMVTHLDKRSRIYPSAMEGGHFHMLADPRAVTTALLKMVERMGVAVKIEES